MGNGDFFLTAKTQSFFSQSENKSAPITSRRKRIRRYKRKTIYHSLGNEW